MQIGNQKYPFKKQDGSDLNPATEETLQNISDAMLILSGGVKFQYIIDDYSEAGITYIGKASMGDSTSSPTWDVIKIDESGLGQTIKNGEGVGGFPTMCIWDDRLTLTYS